MQQKIENMIQEQIKIHDLNIRIFEALKRDLISFEGRSITKRIDRCFKEVLEIKEVNTVRYEKKYSWFNLHLELYGIYNTGYTYDFMLKYDTESPEFDLNRFQELNTCWSAEYSRKAELEQIEASELVEMVESFNRAKELYEKLDCSVMYEIRDELMNGGKI